MHNCRTKTEQDLKTLAVEELSNLLAEWAGTMHIANNLSVQLTAVRHISSCVMRI